MFLFLILAEKLSVFSIESDEGSEEMLCRSLAFSHLVPSSNEEHTSDLMRLNPSTCVGHSVRPNKLKPWSLGQRKVY